MLRMFFVVGLALGVLTLPVVIQKSSGQEYHAAKINTPAPADSLSPEIAKLLSAEGTRVTQGDSRVICEIWLAKEWPLTADVTTSPEILYPLTPGQLVGAIRFPRKSSDFREQDVPAGVYVLRYAQQPVDGAHVGTSATRDFLAMLPVAKDRDPKTLDYKDLTATSKETTGTAHPGILSLQKAADGGEAPSVRQDPDHEWTIVRVVGKSKKGSEAKEMPIELVVVGKAAE
jgi:hypothetical protein